MNQSGCDRGQVPTSEGIPQADMWIEMPKMECAPGNGKTSPHGCANRKLPNSQIGAKAISSSPKRVGEWPRCCQGPSPHRPRRLWGAQIKIGTRRGAVRPYGAAIRAGFAGCKIVGEGDAGQDTCFKRRGEGQPVQEGRRGPAARGTVFSQLEGQLQRG